MHLFKIGVISGKLSSDSKGKLVYVKYFFTSEGLSALVEWTFTSYEQESKDTFKTPKDSKSCLHNVFHYLLSEGGGQFIRKHAAGNSSCLAENVLIDLPELEETFLRCQVFFSPQCF